MLDRDEDMMITGTRHPFLFKYKVGFSNDGLIKVLEVHVYANAGCSWDLSGPVSLIIIKSLKLCKTTNHRNILFNLTGFIKNNDPYRKRLQNTCNQSFWILM